MNGFLNGLLRVGEAPAPLKTKRHSIRSLALVSKVGSNTYSECITVISAKKKVGRYAYKGKQKNPS